MKKRLLATALLSITLLGAVSTQSVKADDTVSVTTTATESEYLGEVLYMTSGPDVGAIVGYEDANGVAYDTLGNPTTDIYKLGYTSGLWFVGKRSDLVVNSNYQLIDKATGEVKGNLSDTPRYVINLDSGYITDVLSSTGGVSLGKFVKYGSVKAAWTTSDGESSYPLPLTPIDSAERETDSSLGEIDSFESKETYTFKTYSANFKTKADFDAFITIAEEKLKALGLSPEKRDFPYYSTESIANLMTSMGYDERLYRIETSKPSYRFELATYISSGKGAYSLAKGLTVFLHQNNELATNRTAYVTLVKEIMDMANKVAAASWGDNTGTTTPSTPTTPTAQPVALASATNSVTVTVGATDSQTITGITADLVTDTTLLGKLPTTVKAANTQLYDIKTLDKDGNFTQISEDATVTLPVQQGRKVLAIIYFLPETGAIENLNFTLSSDGKTVSFVVSHFSHYGIVYADATSASSNSSQSQTTVSSTVVTGNSSQVAETTTTTAATTSATTKEEKEKSSLPKTGEGYGYLLSLLGLVTIGGALTTRQLKRNR